jgi:hypothetical protein
MCRHQGAWFGSAWHIARKTIKFCTQLHVVWSEVRAADRRDYRAGPHQWLVVLTGLLGLLATLPIVAYFSSTFRGFYSRQREAILPGRQSMSETERWEAA